MSKKIMLNAGSVEVEVGMIAFERYELIEALGSDVFQDIVHIVQEHSKREALKMIESEFDICTHWERY